MKDRKKKSSINKKKRTPVPSLLIKKINKHKKNVKSKKPDNNRASTQNKGYKFVKGISGNPKGRPKGSKNKFCVADMAKAIQNVEKRVRVGFLETWIESAWGDASDMATIANFMMPKLKSIEQITIPIDSVADRKKSLAIQKILEERFRTKNERL